MLLLLLLLLPVCAGKRNEAFLHKNYAYASWTDRLHEGKPCMRKLSSPAMCVVLRSTDLRKQQAPSALASSIRRSPSHFATLSSDRSCLLLLKTHSLVVCWCRLGQTGRKYFILSLLLLYYYFILSYLKYYYHYHYYNHHQHHHHHYYYNYNFYGY